MINFYQQYQNFIATIVGIITQILFAKKLALSLILTIIVTAILINMYFIYPLVEYMKIENTRWEATAYAVGATTSLILIRIFINILPAVIKTKLIISLGLTNDIINKEMKRMENEDTHSRQE